MTGPKCIVAFCKNRRGATKNIAFYRLTAERYESWMRAIGRDPKDNLAITHNAICSDHFTSDSYIHVDDKKVLKKSALPSVNLKPVKRTYHEYRSDVGLDVGTACLDVCQPSTSHTPMFSEAHQESRMVSGCSVHNCKNKTLIKGIDVTLFCLPVKLTQKTVWLQRAFGSVDFNRHKDALVCSDHFKEDDFVKQYKGQSLSDPLQKVLKEDAVPSLNLPNFTGDTASNAIVVANKPNAQIAPLGIIIYQYNMQGSNLPNAVLQPAQHQFSIQANGESPLGTTTDHNKVLSRIRARRQLEERVRTKLAAIRADLKAEKQKCALLQRKMAELRSKARELQRSAAEAQTEHAAKDKIHKVFDGSASKSQLRDILKSTRHDRRPE